VFVVQACNYGPALPELISNDERVMTNYRNYYTDETRGIVAEVHAGDIRRFGYSFDNSSLPNQIAAREERGEPGVPIAGKRAVA
jgi:hypothetical protein